MRSPLEIARRLYHDIVVGRTSVKIVHAEQAQTDTEAPIFLIGAYRSGTTMLRYILDSHSRICCPPESEFILPFSSLHTDKRVRNSLRDLGFDEQHLISKMREFISYVLGNYARSVKKQRWADKTPSYIDCLDFLALAFPDAQFIMLYRHGLDQSHSVTRGGTIQRHAMSSYCLADEDFRIGGCRYWSQQVSKMLDFEKRHDSRCHRVLYQELCQSPEEISRELFRFLGEPFEPAVLEYGKFEHTVGKEDGRALAAQKVMPVSTHYANWDAALRRECLNIAKVPLESLGYDCSELAKK